LDKIIVLPEEISSKIAAGEVIEGPYSVVRELIDNAIDADSKYIKVTVNNGGKDYISVLDNGSGMSENDALLSIKKHTTSKIKSIEDINNIATLGFRGEALSSICSVSDFTMITKSPSDDYGTKIICSYGKKIHVQPVGSNNGTKITVKGLFFNLPARKKFLKSNRAESARIKDEVLKKALSFYRKGFYLNTDDRKIYDLAPKKDYIERIKEIFGNGLIENIIHVSHKDDLFSIDAFIANKNYTLSNRNGQFIFINKRPVVDRSLYFSLNNPAKGVLPIGRYMYAFIYIDIDPTVIDVNVHPAKKEIRITVENKIYSSLYHLIEKTLREKFYNVDFHTYSYLEKDSHNRELLYSKNYNSVINNEITLHEKLIEKKPENLSFKTLGKDDFNIFQENVNFSSLGNLDFKGTLFYTYLMFEGDDFFILIDQHAAHERIIYERFKEKDKDNIVKNLLIPINFTPPGTKYEVLIKSIESFKKAGIDIEPFGDESFNIVAIPAYIPEQREERILSGFLEDFYNGKVRLDIQDIRDNFIKIASCRSAVKGKNVLNEKEVIALLKDLAGSKIPYICPHGRPTALKVKKMYLEKLFKRRL